jgi:choline dehydrogenase-like flavoprotein
MNETSHPSRDSARESGSEHVVARERFPDDDLPEGAVVDGATLTREHEAAYDFVVVGSGAAGAVAAHTLARMGFSVAMVEEGPWVKTHEFKEDVYGAFSRMMRDAGTQVLEGHSFLPMLQGRCVGGSTVVNSAIAWRTPEDVLGDWSSRFGLGDTLPLKELEAQFESLEDDLNVRPVDELVLGNNNQSFLTRADERGIGSRVMRRYDKGCQGSGRCLTGCPSAAKQGMNVSYVPWALALGARIYTSARVDRVIVEGGRAVGIAATSTQDAARPARIRLHARHGVFVAASTVQTPNVLHRSGVRARALGRHFQAHPGLALAGRFPDPVEMHLGATQGAESIHYRGSHRFKLETISMQPELAAARIPGVGRDLIARLASYRHVAVWAAQIRAEAEGTVGRGWGGADRVKLSLTDADMRATRTASTVIAEMLFESGASEVWPGIHGVPSVLRSIDDVKLIAEGPLDSRAYAFIATHLFGAARMGPDPETSVVGLDFATHEARGLYVVDSSIFPTNLGVNPQHSIMAISRLAATRVGERTRRASATRAQTA